MSWKYLRFKDNPNKIYEILQIEEYGIQADDVRYWYYDGNEDEIKAAEWWHPVQLATTEDFRFAPPFQMRLPITR